MLILNRMQEIRLFAFVFLSSVVAGCRPLSGGGKPQSPESVQASLAIRNSSSKANSERTKGGAGVGFSLRILEDRSRWIVEGLDRKHRHPRRLFLASWYPTSLSSLPSGSTPMTVGELANVSGLAQAKTASEKRYLNSVDESVARSLRLDLFGQPHLSSTVYEAVFSQEKNLESLLKHQTRAHRNAPRHSDKKCPVVVYHPGAGSAYFENYFLFEELAQRGYCVFASGFYTPDTYIPYVGTFEDSLADLQFIFSQLDQDSGVDSRNRTLIGYSFGAQVALSYAARDPGLSAVVSLDSTYESFPLAQRSAYDRAQYIRADRVRSPLLFVTQQRGIDRSWMESFVSADRWNLRLVKANHDSFRSLGNLDLEPRQDDGHRHRDAHRALVREVLRFVDYGNGRGNSYRVEGVPGVLEDRGFVAAKTQALLLSPLDLPSDVQRDDLDSIVRERCVAAGAERGPATCADIIDYLLVLGKGQSAGLLLESASQHFAESWEIAKSHAAYCLNQKNLACAEEKYRRALRLLEASRAQLNERAANYYRDSLQGLHSRTQALIRQEDGKQQ